MGNQRFAQSARVSPVALRHGGGQPACSCLGRRLSGLSAGREWTGCSHLVFLRPSTLHCARMVAEPTPTRTNHCTLHEGGSVMNMNTIKRASAASVFGLALLAIPAAAQQPTKIDFSNEVVGAEPKALVAVVGIWRIESEAGKNVLAVDGRKWKEGQASDGTSDKARALYGERYAEFLDRVQAYAY